MRLAYREVVENGVGHVDTDGADPLGRRDSGVDVTVYCLESVLIAGNIISYL